MTDKRIEQTGAGESASDSSKLLSCPFCKREHAVVLRVGAFHYAVQCEKCDALGPKEVSLEMAVTAWNRQAI